MKHYWQKIIAGLLIIAVLFFVNPFKVRAAQQYCTPETVAAAQVPSAQTNFTAVIKPTDNRYKTTGNGGHVNNANGYDIRPYSDASCTTAITTYELVPGTYDASAGTFEMWVKFASINVGTVVYLGYGDTTISTDGSSTTAWDSTFTNVYHFPDGSTLSLVDSTSNAFNGSGVNTPTATTGQIDGAINVSSGSNQYATAPGPNSPTAMTYSAWVRSPTFVTEYAGIIIRRNVGISGMNIRADGKLALYELGTAGGGSYSAYDDTGSHTLSKDTWYYITATYDSSAGLVGYVNASVDGTDTAKGDLYAESSDFQIGRDSYDPPNRNFDGKIDELRVSNVARSQDWITTEYNNQVAPTTFWTEGTETPLTTTSKLPSAKILADKVKVIQINSKIIQP